MTTRLSPRQPRRRRTRLNPRRQPSQARSTATVEALLEAAAQVFEAEGYGGATTNRIAERAGVSIGTLYQYYPSKEALAVALLRRHVEAGQRMLTAVAGDLAARPRDLLAALRAFVDAMLELHADRPRLQHLLLEEAPRPPPVEAEMRRLDERAVELVVRLLSEFPAIRRSLGRPTAYMLTQTIELLTHSFAAHPPDGLSRAAFAEELVAVLWGYLTTGPAPGGTGPEYAHH